MNGCGEHNPRTGKKHTDTELKEKLMTDNEEHLGIDNEERVTVAGAGAGYMRRETQQEG